MVGVTGISDKEDAAGGRNGTCVETIFSTDASPALSVPCMRSKAR